MARANAPEWVAFATRLTGESGAVRRAAIFKLKAIRNLPDQLRVALTGPHKYLALDAITAIPLPALLPELLQHSETDENGAFYLAINSLLDSRNRPLITKTYLERLQHPEALSVPAEVVILDTLGRMGEYLPVEALQKRLRRSSFEIRSAALYHARFVLMDARKKNYLALVKEALKTTPFQLRVQAIHLIADLPVNLKAEARAYLDICTSDKNEQVREQCLRSKEEPR